MKAVEKIRTDQPELAERFNRTLAGTVAALDEAKIDYCFIGGVASGGLGRPRATHDIDVFVRPEDTEFALRALAKHGFRTEKTDPSWLYKGWKENILVDVIFKSKGEIYLDREMFQRSVRTEFHGVELRLVAPEDLLVIKASAHSELCPGHWHDALALIQHASLDWAYLVRRARRAPRRVLSLLIYATGSDLQVPKYVIEELYRMVFDESGQAAPRPGAPSANAPSGGAAAPGAAPRGAGTGPSLKLARVRADDTAVARLREAVAQDPRTNELDIQIDYADENFLLRGEVTSTERREAVERVAHELFPGSSIVNQLRVMDFDQPPQVEDVK
jgi:hypothetical protein